MLSNEKLANFQNHTMYGQFPAVSIIEKVGMILSGAELWAVLWLQHCGSRCLRSLLSRVQTGKSQEQPEGRSSSRRSNKICARS